jgi:hypothetical protein
MALLERAIPLPGPGTTTDKKAATVKKSTAPSTAKRRRPKVARSKANHEAAIAATLKGLDNSKPKTAKAAAVLELLRSWLKDESGYDEQTWPKLKKAIDAERDRIGARSLFND